MKASHALFASIALAAAAAGCAGSANPPAGSGPLGASEAPNVRAMTLPQPLSYVYAQLAFDGKRFTRVTVACAKLNLNHGPTYTAPKSGPLRLTAAITIAPTCRPSPLPSLPPRLYVVAVRSSQIATIAGPAQIVSRPWSFTATWPGLTMVKGAQYRFFAISYASAPWQMFHGTAVHNGYAAVAGPSSATLAWRFKAGSGTGNPPNSIAISSAGIVYLGAPTAIYALNSAGGIVWQQPYNDPQGPALSNDQSTLYFAASNALVAVWAKTGKLIWQYTTGNKTIFGPTVAPNDTILQGSFDGYLYDIHSNGTLNWKELTAGSIAYPASVDSNGNVYLGGGDSHYGPDSNAYSFTSKGALRWKYDTTVTQVGTPAYAGGRLFVPAQPWLFSLNPATGAVVWFTPDCGAPPLLPCGTSETTGIGSPAVGADGTIYTVTDRGAVNTVNPTSGATAQIYSTGAAIPSYPLVDKNGTVYVGDTNGVMYAISKTGTLVWSYATGGSIAEASPALGADGTLYFSSQDGYLYAIR